MNPPMSHVRFINVPAIFEQHFCVLGAEDKWCKKKYVVHFLSK